MYGIDYCARFGVEIVDSGRYTKSTSWESFPIKTQQQIFADSCWCTKITEIGHTAAHSTAQHNCCKIQDFICTCDGKIFTVGDSRNGTALEFCGNYSVYKMHQFYFNFM